MEKQPHTPSESSPDTLEQAKALFIAARNEVKKAEQEAFPDGRSPSGDPGTLMALTAAKSRERAAKETLENLGLSADAIRKLE